jgi:hypothetical protein
MDLSDVQVNAISRPMADRLFQRSDLNNLSTFDLAQGTVVGANGLQRAGAVGIPRR